MRRILTGLCAMAIVVAGCGGGAPNSRFEAAGYHVRGDTVYYLRAFPGEAFEITGADAAGFETLGTTYARDGHNVYVDGVILPGADPASFTLLQRDGYASDAAHVYQRDRIISDDPGNFELLDGGLAKDREAVYWSDGSVLSSDPAGFAIISDADYHLFTKDSVVVHVNGAVIAGADPATFQVLDGAYATDASHVFYFTDPIPDADDATFRPVEGPYAVDGLRVYWMGKPIAGADPATFRVLNVDFECSADRSRAFYRDRVIADADPATFPPGESATNCSETVIAFTG